MRKKIQIYKQLKEKNLLSQFITQGCKDIQCSDCPFQYRYKKTYDCHVCRSFDVDAEENKIQKAIANYNCELILKRLTK